MVQTLNIGFVCISISLPSGCSARAVGDMRGSGAGDLLGAVGGDLRGWHAAVRRSRTFENPRWR